MWALYNAYGRPLRSLKKQLKHAEHKVVCTYILVLCQLFEIFFVKHRHVCQSGISPLTPQRINSEVGKSTSEEDGTYAPYAEPLQHLNTTRPGQLPQHVADA